MRGGHYSYLVASARRFSRRPEEAEDLVQDALLEALRQERHPFDAPENMRWIIGVIRNKARMYARGARRRSMREGAWHYLRNDEEEAQADLRKTLLQEVKRLPGAIRPVAVLALTGHTRREIAYLLRLPDPTLRQRISALKRHLRRRELEMPEGPAELTLDIAYGRIRDSLLPPLVRHGWHFASHDPDGHLFFVRRSQNP